MTNSYAVATACLLAMSMQATSVSADIFWGVNGHPLTAYPGVSIEQQLDYVKDLGLRSYRVNVVNADNGDILAELVEAGKARGIDILPVITPDSANLENDSPEELYAMARKLAVDLGTRFGKDIRVWELGNEMENHAIIKPCEKRDDGSQYPCDWGPAGGADPLDYYGPRWVRVSAVLKGLSDGMAEADPGIKRAIGTAGWGHTGAFKRMKQDGIGWDISIWHMYGEDPEWAFREISTYGKPIWVSEFNHPYGSERSARQQADGIRHTMLRLRELSEKYKVEAGHIYQLLDETYWAPSFEAHMGLVRLVADPGNPGSKDQWIIAGPKPAYKAVRDFIRGPQPLPTPTRNCDVMTTGMDAAAGARQASFVYCLILGRKGDQDSIERWALSLENGDISLADMIMEMLHSADFESRYSTISLNNRDYISFLFRLLLHRAPDNWGLETYARQLQDGSMTRDGVAYGIVLSQEFISTHAALGEDAPAASGGM